MNDFFFLLILWLGMGLAAGLKIVFVDKKLSPEYQKEMMKDTDFGENEPILKKNVFILYSTIMGFISVMADMTASIHEYKREKRGKK